jgi:hypothetical protein
MPETPEAKEACCNKCGVELNNPGMAFRTQPVGTFMLLVINCMHCGYVVHTSVVGAIQPTIVRA